MILHHVRAYRRLLIRGLYNRGCVYRSVGCLEESKTLRRADSLEQEDPHVYPGCSILMSTQLVSLSSLTVQLDSSKDNWQWPIIH